MTYRAMRHGLLAFLVLGALCLGWTQAPVTVHHPVEFQGLVHITPDVRTQMDNLVRPLEDQPYSLDATLKVCAQIEKLGWFLRVSPKFDPTTGHLVIIAVENVLIKEVVFIGNSKIIKADELKKAVHTKPGSVANATVEEQDAQDIINAYAHKDFTHVEVTDINITPEGVLKFYIFEPTISEIRVEGNTKTRTKVILRELTFHIGDVFNENDIRNSLRNLERLGIFDEVQAAPEPGTKPGTLVVVIKVKEKRTGMASVGVGHSNIQGLIGFLNVSETNLFGTGQRASAQFQIGANQSISLSYTNPWIDSQHTSFTINLYDSLILREAVAPNNLPVVGGPSPGTNGNLNTYDFFEARRGLDVTFGRPLNKSLNTTVFLALRANTVYGSEYTSDPFPVALTQKSNVHSVAISEVTNFRNNEIYPTTGYFTNLGFEYAGFGGVNYEKLTGEVRDYITLYQFKKKRKPEDTSKRLEPIVFASRLKAGVFNGDPPFLDQFLVGGADTLRGFIEERFPGKDMMLWNNELRFPVVAQALQIVTFLDLGDAWNSTINVPGWGDSTPQVHIGYGLGIRVNTPIGPLRLDYGINTEGGKQFHFGIGATF